MKIPNNNLYDTEFIVRDNFVYRKQQDIDLLIDLLKNDIRYQFVTWKQVINLIDKYFSLKDPR